MLTCSGSSRSPVLGSGRNFPPGQTGTGPRGFFAFLCSIEHDHLSQLLLSLWARLLPGSRAPPGWPLVPCSCGEEGFFFPHCGLARLSGGFLPSSAALSTAPCQGSFGPLCPGACCSCSTKVALMPRLLGEEAFWSPREGPQGVPRGWLLVLWSTEHGPLWGLLWALSATFLPAALAPPRQHSCPGSLRLSCPLLAKKLSRVMLGGPKVVGPASRSGRLWENTALCSSSPSLLWDRSCTSFFKFLLLRKQGLLGLFSCCQLVRGFSSLVIGRHW